MMKTWYLQSRRQSLGDAVAAAAGAGLRLTVTRKDYDGSRLLLYDDCPNTAPKDRLPDEC